METLGISVHINNTPCLIINIYRHPSCSTPHTVFDKLLCYQNKFSHILLIGDFNAHHTYWFNSYDDGPGRSLAKAIDKHNFVILNDKRPTLVLPPGSRDSTIDLALSSLRLAPLCTSRVLDDTWGSDHHPILTVINGVIKSHKRFIYKWPLSSYQLGIFHGLCLKHPVSYDALSGSNSKDKYESFTNHIRTLLFQIIPDKCSSPKSTAKKPCKVSPPWWNSACQDAVDSRRESSAVPSGDIQPEKTTTNTSSPVKRVPRL